MGKKEYIGGAFFPPPNPRDHPTNFKKDSNKNSLNLFLANTQYSEVEYVAKNILKLVREENNRYKDISVIIKNMDTYSNLVRAILTNMIYLHL